MNNFNASFLTEFFKWCFILNYSLMCFSVLIVYLFEDSFFRIHTKLGFYSGNKDNYKSLIFTYFGNWKILVIVFNLIPWIALRIISK